MSEQDFRTFLGKSRGTAAICRRAMLRTTSGLAAATIALTAGWVGTGHAWTIEVKTPTITIVRPTIVTPNVGNITSTVESTVSNVQSQVSAVTAHIADLPDVPAAAVANATANVAANMDAIVQHVTAATNQATASISGQGLAALVNPGLAAANAVQLRTDVVDLPTGAAVTVDFYGDGLINFAVNGPAAQSIHADAAITVASADASSIVDNVINMEGVVHSQALLMHDGQLALVAELAPSAGASSHGSRQTGSGDPLVTILSDPTFRAGSYDGNGHFDQATDPGRGNDPKGIWSEVTTVFFGTATALIAPGTGEEQQNEAQEALTVLSQLDSLIGQDHLAPGDVCQVAGGGGVGLPGCGATETFGAEVTLAPEATTAGCALLSGSGGVTLSCGGPLDALPGGDDGAAFDLPQLPATDPSQSIQDLLDIWLQHPVQPELPVVAARSLPMDQIASAGMGRGPAWY